MPGKYTINTMKLRMRGATEEQIKNYDIPLPPLSEQSAIVSRLDVLSSQLKQIEEKTNKYLADLDELKQSLLKKAFEGKL